MDQIAKYWGMSGAAAAAAMACGEAPSWEEQAFARDAAACSLVWPPRSYSCTFCRREFRSAQALGGHMNVHRRDRARLRARRGDDDGAVEEEEDHHQPRHHQEHYYGAMDVRAVLTNPSSSTAAAAPISNAAPSPSSYLSAIIRESKNSKFLMPVSMAVARDQRQVIHIHNNHDHGSGEDGERMKKRRRVDLSPSPPPSPVGLPVFLPSRAAATAVLVDLHLHLDLDAKVQQGFGLGDHAKVDETTASPSSSSTLVDQQEVDLELRLGTSC